MARVLVNQVRLERTRQFGSCYLGLELWRHLELDRFFEQASDDAPADVHSSQLAAWLAVNRPRARSDDLAMESAPYPSTAPDHLLGIERRDPRRAIFT